MAKNDLKDLLKEIGNPTIEEVHDNLADTLKYFSDNYGEIALNAERKSACMVNSDDILNVLNTLTTTVIWLKINRENFKN